MQWDMGAEPRRSTWRRERHEAGQGRLAEILAWHAAPGVWSYGCTRKCSSINRRVAGGRRTAFHVLIQATMGDVGRHRAGIGTACTRHGMQREGQSQCQVSIVPFSGRHLARIASRACWGSFRTAQAHTPRQQAAQRFLDRGRHHGGRRYAGRKERKHGPGPEEGPEVAHPWDRSGTDAAGQGPREPMQLCRSERKGSTQRGRDAPFYANNAQSWGRGVLACELVILMGQSPQLPCLLSRGPARIDVHTRTLANHGPVGRVESVGDLAQPAHRAGRKHTTRGPATVGNGEHV